MRERKYRLFTNVDRVMVHHEDLMKMPAKDWINHPNLTEYTGLKDKNGVEIWEGDVVRYDYTESDGYGYITSEKISEIIWDKTNAMFCTKTDVMMDTCSTFEVLGNIYEHPHLLKES